MGRTRSDLDQKASWDCCAPWRAACASAAGGVPNWPGCRGRELDRSFQSRCWIWWPATPGDRSARGAVFRPRLERCVHALETVGHGLRRRRIEHLVGAGRSACTVCAGCWCGSFPVLLLDEPFCRGRRPADIYGLAVRAARPGPGSAVLHDLCDHFPSACCCRRAPSWPGAIPPAS